MKRKALLFSVLAMLLSTPMVASGQVIRGVIRADPGESVEGVLILALDSIGTTHFTRITGSDGRFLFSLPGYGNWVIRAERLGFGTGEEEVRVTSGDTLDLAIHLSSTPIEMEGMDVVVVGPRCPNASVSPGVAELWSQAREMLTAISVSATAESTTYSVSIRKRDYRPGGFDPEFVEIESVDTVQAVGRMPMQSAPAAFLMREGFIVPSNDTASYYAPDAEVLLSDPFLSTHCFQERAHPTDPRFAGLAFEPADPARMDIRGTFWIPETDEVLPFVEFTWTRHPWKLMEVLRPGTATRTVREADLDGRTGGRLELRPVDGVGWIIQRWWMRWPIPTRVETDMSFLEPGDYLAFIREVEAEVMTIESGNLFELDSDGRRTRTEPRIR